MEIPLIKSTEKYKIDENLDIDKFIVKSESINKDLDDFISGKIPQGFKIGVSDLDDYFVCKKNEFYILTAKKGIGKTTVQQALQIMFTIVNKLIWVVAYQENSYWSVKLNYMNYLLGNFAKDVKKNNPELFKKASDWIDKYFIFIEVEDIKTATDITANLIKKGKDIHALVLDPINSFRNGWQDTGNAYADGVVSAMEILNFTKKFCSIHISSHPTMSGQRQAGAVTSYQAEGGWFLNKASYTYTIHREKGTNQNQLIVENVRNKHTGGNETDAENPVIIYWYPTKIDIGNNLMGITKTDVIGDLVEFYNPLNLARKEIPKTSLQDAFEIDKQNENDQDDLPF